MKRLTLAIAGSSLLIMSVNAQADIVHADDVITQGSMCIGFDCINGESFGFDTLRLKENNLRIKFEDTSNSASFPAGDWQITVNDEANGGLNRFSIDDVSGGRTPFTIEGSAPTNSLYVDDGGRVGLGTSIPVVELHVVDGDSPTLRLEQDGSSGFTAQTWDLAGNETNFFIRDVTSGSTLPFRIRPGAPTSSIDIAASGNVGFGTASPAEKLHVFGGNLQVEQSAPGVNAAINFATPGALWEIKQNATTGRLTFFSPGGGATTASFKFDRQAQENLLRVGIVAGDTVDINGKLVINGTNVTPDYVFDPDYQLESIEEHGRQMWQKGHLPALAGASVNEEEGVDVVQHQFGVLEELEKAHIYIEQLHNRLATMEEEQRALRESVNLLLMLQQRDEKELFTALE
jgi:hypothetical protein